MRRTLTTITKVEFHRHKKTNSLFVCIILLTLVLHLSTIISNAATTTSYETLIDSVNIGDITSETGHYLFGWGPVEPATHDGYWGGGDDGTLRVLWYNDTANPSDIPTSSPDASWAALQMNIAEGYFASRIFIRALDGIADDSFEVYINNNSVYTYSDGGSTETWKTHKISLLPLELANQIEIRIESTSPNWSGFDTWGQLGISWIRLYARGEQLTTVRFLDSNENPMNNGYIEYYNGVWKEFGTTNFTGNISKIIPVGNYKFRITHAGASNSKSQDIGVNSTVIFNTINVTVRFEDSNASGIPGGNVIYNSGGWKDFGITNESGVTTKELLPRTYTFRLRYDGTYVSKRQDVSINSTIFFNTINVTVRLEDSNNIGLSGGLISYNSGGWKDFGVTNESGEGSGELLPRKYTFKVVWENATISKIQDVSIDPLVIFNTVEVTVKLHDSISNPLSSGIVNYNAGGWKDFGVTNESGVTTKQLLPRKYSFKMNYEGAVISKSQNVGTNSTVIFNTVNVTVVFVDSNGSGIPGGIVTYNSGGWKDFGITNSTGIVKKEILPRKYTFRISYDDVYVSKSQNIGTNSTVIFNTINVSVIFVDSNGDSISGGIVTYNSGGWKDFGVTNESGLVIKELLPRRYTFKMTYDDVYVSKQQDISVDPVVVFSTINVTVRFEDSNGNGIPGGNVSYNAGGWKHFGITNSTGIVKKELLPIKYTFSLLYDNAKISKRPDVSVDPLVIFSTVNTTVRFENSIGNGIANVSVYYYAGGWKDFGVTNESGEVSAELLPCTYKFKIIWDNASVSKTQNLNSDPIVVFRTINVTVKLVNKTGAGIPDGVAYYYAKGWRIIGVKNESGTVKVELLPRQYSFRMHYNGSLLRKKQNVGHDPIVIFSTAALENEPPVAVTDGPYSKVVNETITFNASASYDPDGNLINYTWDFSDGTILFGKIVNHSYNTTGNFTVTLKVTDDLGASNISTTFANITQNTSHDTSENKEKIKYIAGSNKAPKANADGPYEGYIGIEITFNGEKSSDDGTITNYTWDFGDGTFGYGQIVTHKYNTPGIYNVFLTVTDNKGKTNTYETTADLRNLPNNVPSKPIVIYPIDGIVNSEYIFNISSTDKDNDLLRYIINWGDNTTDSSDFLSNGTHFIIKHSWNKPGQYTITIQTDDDKTLSEITQITLTISDQESSLQKHSLSLFDWIIILIITLIFLFVLVILIKNKKTSINKLKNK